MRVRAVVCVYECVSVCLSMCVCVNVCVCVCMCLHTCVYIMGACDDENEIFILRGQKRSMWIQILSWITLSIQPCVCVCQCVCVCVHTCVYIMGACDDENEIFILRGQKRSMWIQIFKLDYSEHSAVCVYVCMYACVCERVCARMGVCVCVHTLAVLTPLP
jgi:hypothetical protein